MKNKQTEKKTTKLFKTFVVALAKKLSHGPLKVTPSKHKIPVICTSKTTHITEKTDIIRDMRHIIIIIIIYLPRTHTTQHARRTNSIWQV